jgi:hypothetical protein
MAESTDSGLSRERGPRDGGQLPTTPADVDCLAGSDLANATGGSSDIVRSDPQSWANVLVWGTDMIGVTVGYVLVWAQPSGSRRKTTAWGDLEDANAIGMTSATASFGDAESRRLSAWTLLGIRGAAPNALIPQQICAPNRQNRAGCLKAAH